MKIVRKYECDRCGSKVTADGPGLKTWHCANRCTPGKAKVKVNLLKTKEAK